MSYKPYPPRRPFRSEHLERFKELYKSEFGIDLTDEKAESEFRSLVAVVRYKQENRRFKKAIEVRESEPSSQPASNGKESTPCSSNSNRSAMLLEEMRVEISAEDG